MKKMSKSKLYQLYVIVIGIILIFAIVAGTTWGVLYYCNYHEEAIPCEDFLDKPDGITVHYVEDGREKSEKLSKEEIDLVFAAFESMVQNCTHAVTMEFTGPSRKEQPTYKTDRFTKGGDVEFHYKQRRSVNATLTAPNYAPNDEHDSIYYYSFSGECDSLSVAYMDSTNLHFVGCMNGVYYRTRGSATFSQESADNFWSVVKSCVG